MRAFIGISILWLLSNVGAWAQQLKIPKFFLDKELIELGATAQVELKEPIEITAEGLTPGSVVTFTVKKHRIGILKHEWKADRKGELDHTILAPDFAVEKADAVITYTQEGKEEKITFYITAE